MDINPNITTAARRLREAAEKGIVCEPVRDLIGSFDIAKAYAVQEINTALRIDRGAKAVGSKIGLTAPVVQKQLGVDQPDFGVLWDDREVRNGGEISMRELMQPRAEAELAFVLGKDLTAENLQKDDVVSAVDHVLASIEIVGSRIRNWDIHITDTIADNASASHWVVGQQRVLLEDIDLVNCKMVMENKGKVVSEGVGENCLGSPINAALWLARKLVEMGKPMRAGDIILTGALGPMVSAKVGDHFRAVIEGAGEVSVKFVD